MDYKNSFLEIWLKFSNTPNYEQLNRHCMILASQALNRLPLSILYLTFRMLQHTSSEVTVLLMMYVATCNIRNVKYKMKMFVPAVCFLFLLKLKWPKDKSIYEVIPSCRHYQRNSVSFYYYWVARQSSRK